MVPTIIAAAYNVYLKSGCGLTSVQMEFDVSIMCNTCKTYCSIAPNLLSESFKLSNSSLHFLEEAFQIEGGPCELVNPSSHGIINLSRVILH